MTAIGIGIGVGLARGAGPRWVPSASASLLSWVRGSDPDATIVTTPDPDEYGAIPDRGSVGGQVAVPSTEVRPQVSALWTPGPAPLYGSGRRLAHSAAASSFVGVQHDGATEVLIGIRFVVNSSTGASRALYGTRITGRGFLASVTDAGALGLAYHNGTTIQVIDSASAAVANGTAYTLTIRKTTTRATAWLGDTQVADAPFSISASTDTPQNVPVIGASSAGGVSFPGTIPEIAIFAASDAADLPDREQLRAYLSRLVYTP